MGALAAFGGGIEQGGKLLDVPLWEQVVAAISSAAYGAALIILAVLLSRREQWIRRSQQAILFLSAVFIVVSVAVTALVSRPDLGPALIGGSAFMALDLAAIYSLRRPDAHRWYLAPGSTPRYVSGAVALWFSTGIAIHSTGSKALNAFASAYRAVASA